MKYIKLDVLNHKQLLEHGYTETNYYCGLSKFQKFATNLMSILKSRRVKFPLNPACFVHDINYNEIFITQKWNLPKRLAVKIYVDFIFLLDMFKILNSKNYKPVTYNLLKSRAILFYLLVTFGTIFYLFYLAYLKLKGWLKR